MTPNELLKNMGLEEPDEGVSAPSPLEDESRRLAPFTGADAGMERFLDLPVDVCVELDRRRVTVGEILRLKKDSLIKLERSAGENVDLTLNGVAVGHGEIVVIEDTMGLRVTGFYDSRTSKGDR